MPSGKQRSLRGLDWLNFFLADVNTGIGPFLAIFLTATRHWNPAEIGIVVATQSIATVAAQAPTGWLVDDSKNKKGLIIVGAFVVAIGCIGIVWAPNLPWQIGNQVLIGLAAALFPPTVAAIALGIVGKENLSGRAGTMGNGAAYLIAVQSLDGIGAAIFGVLWVIIISDLAKGMGRFNLLQGVIQAALGLGAFLSNFIAGFVEKSMGFTAGFLGLATVAAAGFLVFAALMPETREQKNASRVE